MNVVLSPPAPAWGEACNWEWGGVVESTPLPCADPMVSRVAGAAAPFVWFGVVGSLVMMALVLAILVRLR